MGGIAHISLDGACYRLISDDMAKPDRMIFDLAEGQKEKLEALRASQGYRSLAEVLRALIDQAHLQVALEAPPANVKRPRAEVEATAEAAQTAAVGRAVPVTAAELDRTVKSARVAASVPMFVPKDFNPQPKKGAKK